MIRHVVCFKLKQPELAEQAKKILLSMKGNVPQIKDIQVGVDFLRSARSYDVILIVDVENEKALADYQADGYHCSVVKTFMHANTQNSVAIDYKL